MRTHATSRRRPAACGLLVTVLLFLLLPGAIARVIDDFNAGKDQWEDFRFDAALPAPVVENGQFRFTLPPLGTSIFTASTKTSETFELREGRTLELRVDLVSGGGKDSFAVLAFIPTSTGPETLAGYGIAKSTTDILLTKGIGKYFYNENPPTPVRNENVALSLTLRVHGGRVIITGRVLDLENHDAVLFEHTVIDTPGADIMADGTDEPAAPFITEGRIVLYLYEDFDAGAPEDPYQVTFDNLEAFLTETVLLDDFAGSRDAWEDFSFDDALPPPEIVEGRLRLTLPVEQALFGATTYSGRELELREGERLELHADLVAGGGKDSFAIVAFIPNATGPATLAGYGLAKSTTDVLLTKGIGKYFYNENPPIAVPNENVALSLSLTARNGSVHITGRVTDADDPSVVHFEHSVVDTPSADIMADGSDDPAAPFLTQGRFVLYLYADYDASAPETPYEVTFDNATVAVTPGPQNPPPVLSEISPAHGSSFLDASATTISFRATDDRPLDPDAVSVVLNGTMHTREGALVVETEGNGLAVSLPGVLEPGRDYIALLRVEDADGAVREQLLAFDTFTADTVILEAEDYNFGGGQYINDPVPYPLDSGPTPDTYTGQAGVAGIDYLDTRTAPNFTDTRYRPEDPVRMARSLDRVRAKFIEAGGADALVHDYDIDDLEAGEWTQYTRDFAPGHYQVYLRAQIVNAVRADSVLEQVTGDPAAPDPERHPAGVFTAGSRGFDYQNVPLTDALGSAPVVLRIDGTATYRLRHLTGNTGDAFRLLNYLAFVPAPDPGPQPPWIASVSPLPGSTVESVEPVIEVVLQNRDTAVDASTVTLSINGNPVEAEVLEEADRVTVTHALTPLPPPGEQVHVEIAFRDEEGEEIRGAWGFLLAYRRIDPSLRIAGAGVERGFALRVVQAPFEASPLDNTLDRAERQLAPNSTLPAMMVTNAWAEVVNFNKYAGIDAGVIPGDLPIPGVEPDLTGQPNDFAVEIVTWLELPAGVHRFGVNTDDGYKIAVGIPPIPPSATPLAFHNGGSAHDVFDVVVVESGLYAFRMVWYERSGSGFAEWYTVDPGSDERVLLNAPGDERAIRAWREVEAVAAEVLVEWAPSVLGPYTVDPGAVIDAAGRRATVTMTDETRFYRVRSSSALTLRVARPDGGATLELQWD